ncbi:MAG: hypothetical protein HC875_34930 [Anaerolineales bacterium]|nr:hypothetical protein [Anaerolineales bacterium]
MEAAAFQIREQGFGGEPQGIEAFGFGRTLTIGNEKPMLLTGVMPDSGASSDAERPRSHLRMLTPPYLKSIEAN